jgi:hypothetical protein
MNEQTPQKEPLKKPFTIIDYLINLLSVKEGKISLVAHELIASFIIAVVLFFTIKTVPTWIQSVLLNTIIGITGINALSSGINYLYGNYGNNQQEQKNISYDINQDGKISFREYFASMFAALESKFSTINLINFCAFVLCCYLQFSGEVVPSWLYDIVIKYCILGLSAINITGYGLGYSGYGGFGTSNTTSIDLLQTENTLTENNN